MTVDAICKDVADKADMWARTRDAAAGGYVVSQAGEKYLPKLSDQTADEYNNYKGRALFIEATGRTQDAMTGLVFAKEATVEYPDGYDVYFEDIDASGKDWQEFAAEIVDDQQQTGWGAIVVHHNGDPKNPGTRANPSGRAFLQYYHAESVFAWKWGNVGGRKMLTQLRLKEQAAVASADEFEDATVDQIRVYTRTLLGVTERLYQMVENAQTKKKEWTVIATANLMKAGVPLEEIPARLVAADGKRKPGKAPLSALASINLSHWRTSADYEHALHFCGLPTPYATGVSAAPMPKSDIFSALDAADASDLGRENVTLRSTITKQPSIKLGSSTVLAFENPNAKMAFLQLDTAGIGALKEALTGKEQLMAVQGARMLAASTGQPESAEALAIRRSAETSPLVKLVNAVSEAMEDCLAMAVAWDGGDGEKVTFRLNTEFVDSAIDGPTLTAMLGAVNAGAMSLDTFIFNVQRGGRLQPGVTIDDEKDMIANGPQPLGTISDPLPPLPVVPGEPANDSAAAA